MRARYPVWSRDDGIWAVPVQDEPVFGFQTPRNLFGGASYRYGIRANGGGGRAWDWDPNGERFLMVAWVGAPPGEAAAGPPAREIQIVLNWFQELRERVPVN